MPSSQNQNRIHPGRFMTSPSKPALASVSFHALSLAVSTALLVAASAPAQAGPAPSEFNLSELDGSNGYILNGGAAFDDAGISVSAAGDVNGDGVDDLIIGAGGADPNGDGSGRSYVVFGSTTGLPASLNLSSLNGANGFILNGETTDDFAGESVSAAGDVNGDGFADVIIGAEGADPNGEYSGRSYVVFGSDQGFPSPLNLSSLNGINGFALNGVATYDNVGASVSAAGDVNGDGIDDLILGAAGEDVYGDSSGRAYVVFGSQTPFPNPFELNSLNGNNGVLLVGSEQNDNSRFSVSAAGDVNGDGIDDLILGDSSANANGVSRPGRSYVVFGSASGFPNPFNMNTLNGSNGFTLTGAAAFDQFGGSISGAGDVNGDGIDDLIIGAPGSDPNGEASGRSYLVFGSTRQFPAELNVSTLDGNKGFALNGEAAGNRSGTAISGAGDVSGDGVDDVIIGATGATPNGQASGRSYVVFGRRDGVFSDRFENQ